MVSFLIKDLPNFFLFLNVDNCLETLFIYYILTDYKKWRGYQFDCNLFLFFMFYLWTFDWVHPFWRISFFFQFLKTFFFKKRHLMYISNAGVGFLTIEKVYTYLRDRWVVLSVEFQAKNELSDRNLSSLGFCSVLLLYVVLVDSISAHRGM